MVTKIRHTGIVVRNLELSLKFYRDLLGFKIARQMEEGGPFIDRILALENVRVTTVKMTTEDGQMIELLKYQSPVCDDKPRSINDIGIAHVAFTVPDVDRAYEVLLAAGAEFTIEPQLSPDAKAKVTFCRAPEGTHIELVEQLVES